MAMDYSSCYQAVLAQYSFNSPDAVLIRHNENMTYKVTDRDTKQTYLLRIHKPITVNMQGIQNNDSAIRAELDFLAAWSTKTDMPVQLPVSNLQGEWVTTVVVDEEEVHASVLRWIDGEMMTKQDLDNEEKVRTFGTHIACLHQFSQNDPHGFIKARPEYGIGWTETMLSKLRAGEEIGVLRVEEFEILARTFALISSRLEQLHRTEETWGFIHGDINYSNLIVSSTGTSFIDFGLSGAGYYVMDVAMAALLVPGHLRDILLDGYSSIILKPIDIKQLEGFMFLAICGYYSFIVSQNDKQEWIRRNIAGFIEHLCEPFLQDETVYYTV